MKKVISLLTIALLLVNVPGLALEANDIGISGEASQDIIYSNQTESWRGISKLDLEIDRSFGVDKYLYINPEFNIKYDESNHFSDLKIDLDQAYFDLYLENTDLRVGKQKINWGTAYEFNPTDMINPYDLTAEDPLESKTGVSAVKSRYYFNPSTSLAGLVVTDFEESPVPDPIKSNMITEIKDSYTDLLLSQGISPTSIEATLNNNLFINETEPEIDSLGKMEYALNLTKRNVKGYDLSVSYFNGYEDLPSITSDLEAVGEELVIISNEYETNGSSNQTAKLNIGYKETQGIGLNAIGSISEVGVWSELNYQYNEDDEQTLDVVVGSDYTFDNNLYTVGQLIHRSYTDYIIEREDMNYLLLHGDKPFRQIHQLNANLIYDLDNNNYLLNPEINLSLGNNLNLDIGTTITDEDNKATGYSVFNMMSEEKTYFELSYSF